MAPDIRFFTPDEQGIATALCDQLLGQHDEPTPEAKVPLVNLIDSRLAEQQTDGWHYDDMPADGQAWRDTLGALDADARQQFDSGFAACSRQQQASLIQAVQDRGADDWHGLACQAGVEPVDPVRVHRLLLPSLGVERDRLLRPGLPPRLQERWRGQARALRGARRQTVRGPAARPTGSPRVSSVRDRNESAWLLPADGKRVNHQLRQDMRRFDDTDEVDLLVVGCGAGGSTMLQRLARAGWKVVALDAGPFWDPAADWVSDEAGSHHLYWTEPRVISGSDPVPLGSNNSGRGVGGSMVHYAGYTPRFHPSDFDTLHPRRCRSGLADRLRRPKPYYEAMEEELPVAGEKWPWGDPHSYPYRPHPVGGNGEIFLRGADHLGLTAKVGPVAIVNGRFGNRPHCIYRGFCLQGCKVNAKASPLITHIPDALAHGAEVRADSMVTKIEIDERSGRATGVHYVRDGVPHFQRAAIVVRRRLLHRDPTTAPELRLRPLPRRVVQRLRPGRSLPHGAGRPADCRPIRRRGADVQGAAARGQHRGSSTRPTPPSPTSAGSPSRPSHPCRSPGQNTLRPRATGAPTCANT